jgi:hypothetical protein
MAMDGSSNMGWIRRVRGSLFFEEGMMSFNREWDTDIKKWMSAD